MSYIIELPDNFKNEAKKILKKYPSQKNELEELGDILAKNPTTGTQEMMFTKSLLLLNQKEKANGTVAV